MPVQPYGLNARRVISRERRARGDLCVRVRWEPQNTGLKQYPL